MERPPLWRHPALLYLGVALLAFFPSIFLGQAYFANDLAFQFVPFRQFLRDQLAQGHFPLWNPYLLGGQPFFANPNTMMAYPLNYLTLLFPVPYGLGVFLALHVFLAGLGTHLWLKSLRLSPGACRVGALLFSLSGIVWWELIHLQILAAYALFPWMMWTLEEWLRPWSRGWGLASGFTFALIFCCGGFQSTTLVFYTALCLIAYRTLRWRDPQNPAASFSLQALPWKRILISSLFFLWGSLPLLALLIPSEEFSRLSNRREPGQTYENFNGTFSMTPASTYELLFPTLGLPEGESMEAAIQQVTDQLNVGNDYLGAFGYLGVWLPFLAALAFLRKDKGFLVFLASLGALSLLTAWGRYVPLHRLFCAILPGIDLSRAPFRFIQTYVLVGAALAAFGYQTLERRFQEATGASKLVFPAVIFSAFLLLFTFAKPTQGWREMLALALGLGGLSLWGATQSWKALGNLMFQAALVLPLLLTGWSGFHLGPPSNFDYADNFPAFSSLQSQPGPGRYYLDSNLPYPFRDNGGTYTLPLPENAVVPLRIRDIGGYSPIRLIKTDALHKLPFGVYAKLMAFQGILAGRAMAPNNDLTDETIGTLHLLHLKSHPPFVYSPAKVTVLGKDEEVLAALGQKDADPEKESFVTQPLAGPAPDPKASAGSTYQLTLDEVDHQVFQVHQARAGLTVFSEIMFPGWKARLDGSPAPLLTANTTFRSLEIPAGDHKVEFLFQPWWETPILLLLLLWTLSMAVYGALRLRKKPAVA